MYFLSALKLSILHANRLEGSTRAMYNSSLKHWFEFIDQRESIAGNYLMEGCDTETKTKFACLFAAFCFEKHFSLDSSFSALRDHFIVHFRAVDFMEANVFVQSARKSIRKEILKAKKEQSCNITSSFRLGVPKQAPTIYDMIRDLRNWCFVPDKEIVLKNAQIYLGAAVQYCFGLRASNICWKGPKTKHFLKSNDVVLETIDHRFLFRHEVSSSGFVVGDFVAVHLLPESCKTGKWGNEILSLHSRTPEEDLLQKDLIWWSLVSIANPDELFFSHSYMDQKNIYRNKKLIDREVSMAMKLTATRLGLDPDWYTTHCNRIGAATDMSAVLGKEEALKLLGWTSNAGLSYARIGSRENSLSILREKKNLTAHEILRMKAFSRASLPNPNYSFLLGNLDLDSEVNDNEKASLTTGTEMNKYTLPNLHASYHGEGSMLDDWVNIYDEASSISCTNKNIVTVLDSSVSKLGGNLRLENWLDNDGEASSKACTDKREASVLNPNALNCF